MEDREPVGYLVDTNVISRREDIAPGRPVERWILANAPLIRMSVITIAEARRGLVLAERKLAQVHDARVLRRERPRLAAKLEWYRTLRQRFADRIEPIDAEVAERWAEVSVDFPSLRDGDKAILATALVRGYGIATRNIADFRDAGVKLVDPFDPETWDPDTSSEPES